MIADRPSWKPPVLLEIKLGASWDKPRCQHFTQTIIRSRDKLTPEKINALRTLGFIPDGMSFRRISESVESIEVIATDNAGTLYPEMGTRTFQVHVQVWESFYDSGD